MLQLVCQIILKKIYSHKHRKEKIPMETTKNTNLDISLELANIIKQFAKRFQIEIDAKNFTNYLETHCQNALVHFIVGDAQLEDIAIIIERFEDYSYQLTNRNIEIINEDYFALEDEILFFYNQLQQKHNTEKK